MTEITLKPCPFCNTSGENLGLLCDPTEGSDNSGPSRRVQCYGCNIEAPFYDSADEAIAAWNTRQAEAKVEGLLREARDRLEALLTPLERASAELVSRGKVLNNAGEAEIDRSRAAIAAIDAHLSHNPHADEGAE